MGNSASVGASGEETAAGPFDELIDLLIDMADEATSEGTGTGGTGTEGTSTATSADTYTATPADGGE